MKNYDGYRRAIEENLLIVDKNKKEIPFKLNKAQDHFLKNSTNRNIILKARKMGFCLDKDTKILRSNLTWDRLENIAVGDTLVAVDEHPQDGRGMARTMQKTEVLAKSERIDEAYEIVFEDGRKLVATAEHRFLSAAPSGVYRKWRQVSQLKPGFKIRYITTPWENTTIDDAWFGGMIDGEGHLRVRKGFGGELRVCQNTGAVCDRLRSYLDNLGLYYVEDVDSRENRTLPNIRFGIKRLNDILYAVGKSQPTRFANSDWWVGASLPGKKSGIAWETIVSITPVGQRTVIDLQTSTGTFIAEGFVSHNSSVLLAVAVIKFLYGENERCVSMSFDKEASAKQLERAKRFLNSYQQVNKTNFKWKNDNKYELVLNVKKDDGTSYTNSLRVGTAKSSGFGRGDDITFLHLTEVSMADDIETLLAGAGEAVVNDAMITMETTANGYNPFKSFWDDATLGKRNYKPFFYSPDWEYDAAFIEQKKQELGRLFDQEYPSTPELAFLTSGQLFFDQLALRDYLDKTMEPVHV